MSQISCVSVNEHPCRALGCTANTAVIVTVGRWEDAQEPLKSFSTKLVTWSSLSSQHFLFYSFRCMQPCRAQCGFYLSYVSVLIPSVDAGLMHFLEKQEKHRLFVLFSSYFSIKGSHTDPRFLHWKWTGIPVSQLEKPEEKQDQSLLQFVPDGIQVQCLAVTLAGGSLAQNGSRLFKDPKGWLQEKKKIQLQMSSCGESRLHEVFQPAHAGCQAWPVALCPTSARASPCPFPCFVPCFFYMIYVSGWWIERLPWLCWSQGQLHLPSSASKPDCGWNTSRCYNFKFSFRLINALMVIAVDL